MPWLSRPARVMGIRLMRNFDSKSLLRSNARWAKPTADWVTPP